MDIMNILASCLLIHTYAYMHIHVYGWFIPSELFESKLQVWTSPCIQTLPSVSKDKTILYDTNIPMIQWPKSGNSNFQRTIVTFNRKDNFFLWFRSSCCIYILWSVSLFLVWNSNSTWPCLSWVPHFLKSTGYLIERRPCDASMWLRFK